VLAVRRPEQIQQDLKAAIFGNGDSNASQVARKAVSLKAAGVLPFPTTAGSEERRAATPQVTVIRQIQSSWLSWISSPHLSS